jgi:hypothetical protein
LDDFEVGVEWVDEVSLRDECVDDDGEGMMGGREMSDMTGLASADGTRCC